MNVLTNYSQLIRAFVDNEALPETYAADAEEWFVPLAELCLEVLDSVPALPLCIGINGCQGSGKSTLAALLKALLTDAGKSVLTLSIDDFYLDSAARRQLAENVHPLLQTRGVPGTHDVSLALQCLAQLQSGQALTLPVFNKALDNPCPPEQWVRVDSPVDLVVLEGWFVGVAAQSSATLVSPVNELETREDPNGEWRRWVNEQLAGNYQQLFEYIDLLIMLQASGFESVFGWRQQQERKLRLRLDHASNTRLMDDTQLQRFIQHYERLTRHCLDTLPAKADIVFELNTLQRIIQRRDLDYSVAE